MLHCDEVGVDQIHPRLDGVLCQGVNVNRCRTFGNSKWRYISVITFIIFFRS